MGEEGWRGEGGAEGRGEKEEGGRGGELKGDPDSPLSLTSFIYDP